MHTYRKLEISAFVSLSWPFSAGERRQRLFEQAHVVSLVRNVDFRIRRATCWSRVPGDWFSDGAADFLCVQPDLKQMIVYRSRRFPGTPQSPCQSFAKRSEAFHEVLSPVVVAVGLVGE